jgi:hypothetical protein
MFLMVKSRLMKYGFTLNHIFYSIIGKIIVRLPVTIIFGISPNSLAT